MKRVLLWTAVTAAMFCVPVLGQGGPARVDLVETRDDESWMLRVTAGGEEITDLHLRIEGASRYDQDELSEIAESATAPDGWKVEWDSKKNTLHFVSDQAIDHDTGKMLGPPIPAGEHRDFSFELVPKKERYRGQLEAEIVVSTGPPDRRKYIPADAEGVAGKGAEDELRDAIESAADRSFHKPRLLRKTRWQRTRQKDSYFSKWRLQSGDGPVHDLHVSLGEPSSDHLEFDCDRLENDPPEGWEVRSCSETELELDRDEEDVPAHSTVDFRVYLRPRTVDEQVWWKENDWGVDLSYVFTDADGDPLAPTFRDQDGGESRIDETLAYLPPGIPLPRAVEEGWVRLASQGLGRATGEIFDLTLTNASADPITVEVPVGTVFTPGSEGYQRMVAGESIRVDLEAGATEEVTLSGYCLDPELAPPPAPGGGETVTYLPSSEPAPAETIGIIEVGTELWREDLYDTPFEGEKERDTVIQWSLWHQAEPEVYTEEKLEEEIRSQFEEAGAAPTDPEVEEEITRGTESIWNAVDLTLKEASAAA